MKMIISAKFRRYLVALCLVTFMGEAFGNFQLNVLHTNDIHARVQEINKYNGICDDETSQAKRCYGGYARIKTKVDELRGQHTNTILVDGGDEYQGSLWFYLYGGKVMSHFMNHIGYSAMGLGNHEFDNGPEGLVPFLKNATFPVLSCNIDASSYPELSSIKKSTIIERSGEKIGIIGYTTIQTPFISKPGNVAFSNEINSIQQEVNVLKSQGVNKIIAIGHAGYTKDKEIAEKVSGLDVIVGGHSNTFLYTGQTPTSQQAEGDYPTVITREDGQKVLVVQDYAYGKYLGQLLVTFDDNGNVVSWSGNPILLDHTVKRDPAILEDVMHYLPDIMKRRNDKIGTTLVDLIGDRSQCRRYECNLGNLITDAMVRQNLRHSDGLGWSKVAIAVVNGGGIRADLPQGEISVADVLAVQPFGNTVDIVEISGETILAMLEHCASLRKDQADGWGGFLQFSGLRVIYNQSQPTGNRVYRVDVLCGDCKVPEFKPLEKTKRYMVLMQNFLSKGSMGYGVITNGIIKKHTIGNLDADILMDYIKDSTPITTGLDGRIRFVEDTKLCL